MRGGVCVFVHGFVQLSTGTEKRPGTLKRRPAHDCVLYIYFALCRGCLTGRSGILPTAGPTLVVCVHVFAHGCVCVCGGACVVEIGRAHV